MDYRALMDSVSPGFFEREYIRRLPPEDVSSEMILDLKTFDGGIKINCPEEIRFGFYHGDPGALHAAVAEVDDGWVQYFNLGSRCFCAFDSETVVSFCLLDDMCRFDGLRVSGPGCVGTVPQYRGHGPGPEHHKEPA